MSDFDNKASGLSIQPKIGKEEVDLDSAFTHYLKVSRSLFPDFVPVNAQKERQKFESEVKHKFATYCDYLRNKPSTT